MKSRFSLLSSISVSLAIISATSLGREVSLTRDETILFLSKRSIVFFEVLTNMEWNLLYLSAASGFLS